MVVVAIASILGLATSAMAGSTEMAALVATLLGVFFSFLLDFIGMFGGNYYLAVELVNLMGVEEWAYSNGVAVMTLTSGVVVSSTRGAENFI
jgi:hypothetical protein